MLQHYNAAFEHLNILQALLTQVALEMQRQPAKPDPRLEYHARLLNEHLAAAQTAPTAPTAVTPAAA